MAENYGSLTGTLDAHDTLEGNLDNHGEMSGEVQFGGAGSKVDDVLVNGESVVENKIAHIDLTPYAEIENVYDKTTIDTALEGKADVEDIPTDLSELQDDADHRTVTDAEKTEWSGKADTSDIPTALSQLTNDDNYVQDEHYQHTDNNYTDNEKNKLADIESGAEANVQSDWNESDTSSDAYILNKPTIPSVVANPQNTTATLTSIGIDGTNYAIQGGGGGGAVNDVKVNDTSVVDSQGVANIDLTGYATTSDIPTDLADLQGDSTHRLVTDTEKTTWNNKSDFSGSYNDLTDKPTIPSALADLTDDSTHRVVTDTEKTTWNGKSDFSGSYNDLTDKPTIPDAQIQSDWNQSDNTKVDFVKNKPSIPTAVSDLSDDSTHRVVTDTEKTTWNGKSDFSGSYTDLTDKPTLGTASALDVASSGDASTTEVVKGDDSRLSDARTPVSHTHTTSDITDFPTMSDYIQKSNTSGLVKNDGTIDTNSYATTSQIPDISGKADKVSGATNGNLAGLNASGNLTDSTWSADKTTQSTTGNPISISGLKSNQLAIDPIITLEPIQAGSGTPSPSNIRAISGYDKIEVLSCGKNIAYKRLTNVSINGSGVVSSFSNYDLILAHVKSGTNYVVSGISDTFKLYGFFITEPTTGSVTYNNSRVAESGSVTGYSFTAPINGWVAFRTANSAVNVQCEEGSTATTYEAPIKTTDLSESLGQTVYGGSLDVRTGKLVSRLKALDMSTMNWQYSSGLQIFYCYVSDIAQSNPIWCSCYNPSVQPITENYTITSRYGHYLENPAIVLKDMRYTDATSLKNALTGQTVVYTAIVSAKTTIQLTPHEISLLKDYAYVSTNGTSISLDYHNGEMASLGDVSQLGETLNILGDNLSNRLKVKALNYLYSGATVVGTVYTVNNAKSVVFGLGDEDSFGGFSIFYVVGNQNICYNMTPTFNASNNTFSFLPTAANSGAVRFMGIVFYTKK